MVKDLRDSLAERGLRVPALSGNLDEATKEYIQAAFVTRDHTTGGKYGLQYAEEFHYIGPDASLERIYLAQCTTHLLEHLRPKWSWVR